MAGDDDEPDDGWTEIDRIGDGFESLNHSKLQTLYFSCQMYIGYLIRIARLMESESSLEWGPDSIKLYAWEIEDTANTLKHLLKQLKQ